MTLQELLNSLENMGLIAILSPSDVEYAVTELCDASPDELTVCLTDRVEFSEANQ